MQCVSGRDGRRWNGKHVSGSLCHGQRSSTLWWDKDGGSDREGRVDGCLQQISHGTVPYDSPVTQ